MNREIIQGLVYNASLLLAISIIYNTFFLRFKKGNIGKEIIVGVIVGFIGILLMGNPVRLTPGIIFDTRSILVSVTAMFFGMIPTIFSVVIVSAYRAFLGGDGALMGVLVTILTGAIGLVWNKLRLNQTLFKKKNILIEFYLVGVIVHVGMLICVLALPPDMIWNVFSQISIPVLLIYPIGSLLLCIVLFNGFTNIQTRIELIESEVKYKNLYHEYQNKQTLLVSLINTIPDLIFYKDQNSVYVGCNSAFEKFAGKKEKDIVGHTDIELFDISMAEVFRTMDREMLKLGSPKRNEEVVTYPDGTEVFLETLKTPYFDNKGKLLGLIGISRDITERKKWEKEILYLTYHDVLTGLYNRTFFEEEKKRLDTKRQLPLSVITGDLNGLKLINDAFGHAEGDKLLIEIAKILKKCSRAEDIVARTGGDEFCILLPKTDSKGAQSIVDRIMKACDEFVNESDMGLNYTSISLGHATKTKVEEPFDQTIRISEEFMYKRKMLEYKSIHSSILSSIKTTMFEKSNETEAHAERLAEHTKKLGQALGLADKDLVELELLSTLHDIGKISIDASILTKPGKLSEEEWFEVKKHPEVGYRITLASPDLKHISEYILSHHERWDGKGYPQGLSGENIPLLSRILSVVDAYDAMTQDRSYRKAMSNEDAIEEIRKNAGTQFDPYIAEIFIEKVLMIWKNSKRRISYDT